ncbi:hypothetical protein [Haladaptatus sp. DFWS20]|uniref:hypothetical protein n=1 Tax=Haladaptatus sp. DFWS20 TaxID=3403467 RepID=UPI003EBC5551
MPGYYDLILGLIPLALIGVTSAISATGLSLTPAVPIGATISIFLIGHALFVNDPFDVSSESMPSTPSSQMNSAD